MCTCNYLFQKINDLFLAFNICHYQLSFSEAFEIRGSK